MKEYNIYVKRPPAGEIIIYMLTYHVTIGLRALAILLDSRVRELAIKRLNVNNSFTLAQRLRDVHKNTIAKFNHTIAVDVGGVVLVNMETRDGDEILTHDGVNIEAWHMAKELEVLERMFSAANKDDLCVDAGGIATEWLLTNDGVEILTRDGDEIEAVSISNKLPVFFKQTIDGKVNNPLQFYADTTGMISQDILICNEHETALTSGMVDMSGEQTFTLETRDGVTIETRSGIEIVAWRDICGPDFGMDGGGISVALEAGPYSGGTGDP